MNHLRSLIEAQQVGLYADGGDDRLTSEWSQVRATAERAMCFWLGDVGGMTRLQVADELCRLPFEICWFEFQQTIASVGLAYTGVLAWTNDRGQFEAMVFELSRGVWAYHGDLLAERLENSMMSARCAEAAGPYMQGTIYAIKGFLTALHCCNVERQEHKPEPKLAKARERRGKAPLFSYWTLQLDAGGASDIGLGGTHTSPRLHLRRGHPRKYASGKWTWVHPHMVGNKALGMVHKDYSAGPTLGAQ